MPADSVSFDKTETEALRMIVSDWVNAKIVSPPYNREIELILSKLDIDSGEQMREHAPVTQEHLSERALVRPKEEAK